METVRDKILVYLRQHPEGADDDELTIALHLRQRQQANSCCRQLTEEGLIDRVKHHGEKVRNFWKDGADNVREVAGEKLAIPHGDEPWYWEGNVQASVVTYLASQGYSILRVASTRDRERGKDIEAESDSGVIWVTVKGYPKGTPRTRPQTQAGHWFSGALFDIICWRGQNFEAELAMALPDFPRYRDLAKRVSWLRSPARFYLIWVREDGEVQLER